MMVSGWRYRLVSVVGAGTLAVTSVLLANHALVQRLFTTYVPPFDRLSATVLDGYGLALAMVLSVGVVLGSLVPLYRPRPRRILDMIFLAQKRVLVATFALATLGYFNWSYRLPRSTLALITGLLVVVLPAWFVAIRNRPAGPERAVVVGNDVGRIEEVFLTAGAPIVGYLSSPRSATASTGDTATAIGDGGVPATAGSDVEYLGGLSRLDDVLVDHDVDTAILAFTETDRGEFFGALTTCHAHGVAAKVLQDDADSVLAVERDVDDLVAVDLDPWDWQDHLVKRVFDVGFAAVGLLAFAPVMAAIAVAIKLDSPGSVFYTQERTAGLGRTVEVRKFRTMVPENGSSTPVADENNDRITRVGRVLRKSNLDELPQLGAILVGKMSAVGPRAVWTDEEPLLESEVEGWRKRWFVKPGLTGLAQVNEVSSTDPQTKLRHDLAYIRNRSFWFDVKIVIRQLWIVGRDLRELTTAVTR